MNRRVNSIAVKLYVDPQSCMFASGYMDLSCQAGERVERKSAGAFGPRPQAFQDAKRANDIPISAQPVNYEDGGPRDLTLIRVPPASR
jgi:hypothetical protein